MSRKTEMTNLPEWDPTTGYLHAWEPTQDAAHWIPMPEDPWGDEDEARYQDDRRRRVKAGALRYGALVIYLVVAAFCWRDGEFTRSDLVLSLGLSVPALVCVGAASWIFHVRRR